MQERCMPTLIFLKSEVAILISDKETSEQRKWLEAKGDSK